MTMSDHNAKPQDATYTPPMDQAQAASFLGVCIRTLLTLRKNKGLPYFHLGGQVRYDRNDLIEWLRQQRQRQAEA